MGDEPGSPAGSDRGSVSTTFSTKPDMAVEQQILSRVAFVCNPPAHKLPANPLVNLPLISTLLFRGSAQNFMLGPFWEVHKITMIDATV